MSCTPCQRRRQMLAEAKEKGGAKGVMKIIPAVVKDTVKNPPQLVRKGKPNG